jgi:hypothetical protein
MSGRALTLRNFPVLQDLGGGVVSTEYKHLETLTGIETEEASVCIIKIQYKGNSQGRTTGTGMRKGSRIASTLGKH